MRSGLVDYEFVHDRLTGGYHAKMSVEHEIFGRWLIDEVGNDQSRLKELVEIISDAKNRPSYEIKLEGKEYSLMFNQMDVTVEPNIKNALTEDMESLEPDVHTDTLNQSVGCGIEDFKMMIDSWFDFIKSGR